MNHISQEKIVYLILGLMLIVHSFVLTKLIFFPYPELFIYPYLANNGLKPYSEILDQHFPGLLLLPVNFNNLGMTTPEMARVWLIATIILTHILLFICAKVLLKSSRKALMVNLLYLIWQPFFDGWVLWIDTFLPLFLLPAFYFTQRKKLFLSGIFLGLAIVFKQTIIPLSGFLFIYFIISKHSIKSIFYYSLGLLTPIVIMLLYILGIGVFWDFWYWNLVFNLFVYAKSGAKSFVQPGFLTRIVFVYIFSLLPLIFRSRNKLILLYIFLLGSSVSIIDRADFVHLQPSLPFVLLATSFGLLAIKNRKIIISIILIYSVVAIWWQVTFYKGHLGDKVFFFDEQSLSVSNKIKQNTSFHERIFIYGAVSHLYQMSNTLPAGNIFVFQFPWFLKVTEDRILAGLIQDKPKIIVYDSEYNIEGVKLSEFSKKIYQYIESNYKKIDNVNSIQILQRIY